MEQQTTATDAVYELPCSTVERVCWYLERLNPGTGKFNIAVRFLLRGPQDHDVLERAIEGITDRHEILRTTFIERDGMPMQMVRPHLDFKLGREDLRHLGVEERTQLAEQKAAEEAVIGFDLTTGPLFRAKVLVLEDEEAMLLLTIHHIVADGWSVGLFTDEMGKIYESLRTGHDADLPELPIQYADYACWQAEWFESEDYKRRFGELKHKLDGFEPIQLPLDFDRPSIPKNRGEIRSILLPLPLTQALKQFSERNGLTLFVTMLSAFVVLLRWEAEAHDITLRTQVAGRDRVEFESLIGWFVNTVILRIQTGDNPTFKELAEEVRKVVFETLEYKDIPFENLIEEVDVVRQDTRNPQLPVNFILQRDFVKPWRRGGMSLVPLPSKAAGAFVDLILFLVEREDGWRCSVDVNTDVLTPETGEFFLANMKRVLEAVARDPEVRVNDVRLERRQITRKPSQRDQGREIMNNYVPPRTPVEVSIAKLWERVLRRGPVGAYSNFFDLGGHSLNAVTMLNEIKKEYGLEIKVQELFIDPTPAAMAKVLTGENVYSDSGEIIPIQPLGDHPPVFLIGGDNWFRPLATSIGVDIPMLGAPITKYRHMDMDTARPEVGKAMAEMLLAKYPNTPFYLAGWCADGMTAYETGKQIQELGGKVELVVLFDAMNPGYFKEVRGLVHSAGRTWNSLKSIWKASVSGDLGSAIPKITSSLGGVASRMASRVTETFGTTYNAAPVKFPLIVVRPPVTALEQADLGWSRVSPDVTVVEVPGDHSSIFKEPHVQEVGLRLRKQLLRFMDRERPA